MLELGGNKQQTNQVSSVKIEPRDDHCPMENGNFGHHHHHGRSVHANGNSSSSDSSFHHHPASMMAPTTTAATSAINKGSLNHHCIQRFNYSNGFLPPTPPSSDPGSPSQDSPQRNNKPPPPPYSALLGPRTKQPSSSSSSSSSTSSSSSSGGSTQETDKPPTSNYFFFPSFSLLFFLFKSIEWKTRNFCIKTVKYNRRNNPELEKRRIHHCDFPGCTKVYTKSSHLKAHQRIHTGSSLLLFLFPLNFITVRYQVCVCAYIYNLDWSSRMVMGYTRHGRECQWLSIKSWPQKWKYSIHSASSSFFSDFLLNFRVFVFVCIYGSSLMLVEQVLTKCSPKRESRHNAFCCWQVRNLTAATGQSVNGVSPAPTSWPVTIGNTRAPNLSAARSANAVSPDPTISPCTWNGTYPRAPNANASALLYLIYYNVTNETIRRRNGDQHIISTRLYSNNLPVFVCMFVFCFLLACSTSIRLWHKDQLNQNAALASLSSFHHFYLFCLFFFSLSFG